MREGSIKVRCIRWGSNPDQLSGGSIRGPRRVTVGSCPGPWGAFASRTSSIHPGCAMAAVKKLPMTAARRRASESPASARQSAARRLIQLRARRNS